MTYEKTPVKPTKLTDKDLSIKELERLGTPTILWQLVKRHKVGLLATWAIVITLLYVFPPLPQIILGVW